MIFLKLISDIQNPQNVRLLENEINCLSKSNISQLYFILENMDYNMPNYSIGIFYLFKIIELKIKTMKDGLNSETGLLEINDFIERYISNIFSISQDLPPCVVDAYILLALYCWPMHMTNFWTFIENNIYKKNKIGFELLCTLLVEINYSSEIDNKRRYELKKAVSILIEQKLLPIFQIIQPDNDLSEYMIKIYKELLRISSRLIQLPLIFMAAKFYPDAAIDFFVEHGTSNLKLDQVYNVLEFFPPDLGLIETFFNKNIVYDSRILKYMYSCIDNFDTFNAAIVFWTKFFSVQNDTCNIYIKNVLIAIFNTYSLLDDIDKSETETLIFNLLFALCKTYPMHLLEFFNTSVIENKFIISCLHKISKKEIEMNFLTKIQFSNNYLNAYVLYLNNNPKCIVFLNTLDYNDNEQIKLAISIIEKYNLPNNELIQFYNIIQHIENEYIYELLSVIDYKLNNNVTITFNNNVDVIKYFYYLKKDFTYYKNFSSDYIRYFIQYAPFDRCFSIISKLNLPSDDLINILKIIYENIDHYPLIELSCLNNDLLINIKNNSEVINCFIEKETYMLLNAWNNIKDYKTYYNVFKSLLVLIDSELRHKQVLNYGNILIDLLYVDYSIITNKILTILLNNILSKDIQLEDVIDTKKAVYNLGFCYNLPNLITSQPLISQALTLLLVKDINGPNIFSEIFNFEINKCVQIKNQIKNMDKKGATNIIKNFIKDFKGQALNKMYKENNKVKEFKIFNTLKTETCMDNTIDI